MINLSTQDFALRKMQQAAEIYGADFQAALAVVPESFIQELRRK